MNKMTRLTLAAAAIATLSGTVLATPEPFVLDSTHSYPGKPRCPSARNAPANW